VNADVSAEWRARIVARARRCCEYCRAPLSLVAAVTTFHVEHIMPRSRGGQTVDSNLALSCPNCNLHKSARIAAIDPETGVEAPLFNPRTHAWQEHFALSADRTHIIGTTPIGRATVAALHFNNPEHIDARQLWVAGGWYPPPDVA
jgi:hypothetical protein